MRVRGAADKRVYQSEQYDHMYQNMTDEETKNEDRYTNCTVNMEMHDNQNILMHPCSKPPRLSRGGPRPTTRARQIEVKGG